MKYKEGTLSAKIAKNVYAAPIIITLSGAIISMTPNWSPLYGMITGIILIISMICFIIGWIFKLHLMIRWHAISMMFTFHTLSLACLLQFWRVFGETFWLFTFLMTIYVVYFWVTYKYRHIVAKGIYSVNVRKTLFGKIYWRLSFIYLLLAGTFT